MATLLSTGTLIARRTTRHGSPLSRRLRESGPVLRDPRNEGPQIVPALLQCPDEGHVLLRFLPWDSGISGEAGRRPSAPFDGVVQRVQDLHRHAKLRSLLDDVARHRRKLRELCVGIVMYNLLRTGMGQTFLVVVERRAGYGTPIRSTFFSSQRMK